MRRSVFRERKDLFCQTVVPKEIFRKNIDYFEHVALKKSAEVYLMEMHDFGRYYNYSPRKREVSPTAEKTGEKGGNAGGANNGANNANSGGNQNPQNQNPQNQNPQNPNAGGGGGSKSSTHSANSGRGVSPRGSNNANNAQNNANQNQTNQNQTSPRSPREKFENPIVPKRLFQPHLAPPRMGSNRHFLLNLCWQMCQTLCQYEFGKSSKIFLISGRQDIIDFWKLRVKFVDEIFDVGVGHAYFSWCISEVHS